MSSEPSYASVDLADYVRVVSRRRWLVAAFAVGGLVLAFLFAQTQATEYTTGTQLRFAPAPDSLASNPRTLAAYVQDEAGFVRSTTVASRAADILKSDDDPRSLVRRITVVVPTEGQVVNVRATAEKPTTARSISQAFAQAYIDLRSEAAQDELDRQLRNKDAEITGLEASLTDLAESINASCDPQAAGYNVAVCTTTTNQQQRVSDELRTAEVARQALETTPVDGGEILSPAPVPREPSTPGPFRTSMFGLVGGLLVGLAAAFVFDRLDARVRDKGEIEAAIGLTPLASVPTFAERFRTRSTALVTIHAPDSPEADAFRRLRASVLIAMEDADGHVLGLTSANAAEGKSTVSSNLAVTLSQAGHSVVILSADIRRPSLEQLFGLPAGPGLGEVLEGKATLDQAIHFMNSSLAVLRSGQAAGNPGDLLLNPRLETLITSLRDQFDYVIIDTPPVLAVADTLGMVRLVDAVAIVVSLDDTTSAEAAEAEEQLRRVGANLIGAVINRAAPSSERYYGYRES